MIVDTILEIIESRGMSKTEAAAEAGMSRQNFNDKISNGNPRVNSVEQIMAGLGYEPHVEWDPDFAYRGIRSFEDGMLQALRETNLCYNDAQKVLKSIGAEIVFTEKPPIKGEG